MQLLDGSLLMFLCEGDGNDNGGACSFPESCRRALEAGWRVELWSWRTSLSGKWRSLAAELNAIREGAVKIQLLDDHLEAIKYRPPTVCASQPSASCTTTA
jgi:hypothetical protein